MHKWSILHEIDIDYLDLLDVTSPDKLQLLQLDIDKVAEALIRDELDNHLNVIF